MTKASMRSGAYPVWGIAAGVVVLMCLFLSASTWKQIRKVKMQLAHLHKQSVECEAVPLNRSPQPPTNPAAASEVEVPEPPADPVSKEKTYVGDNGAKLPTRLLKTTVVQVAASLERTLIRFEQSLVKSGTRKQQPSKQVTIVNFWATYCKPCQKELPEFRTMFRDHAETWGDQVRFVAVKLDDGKSPDDAYAKFGPTMPEEADWLSAQTGVEDEVLEALKNPGDDEAKLYYGNVPVTLILDCKRRVRWTRFREFKPEHFAEFANTVDRLVAEFDTAKCKQTWRAERRSSDTEDSDVETSMEPTSEEDSGQICADAKNGKLCIVTGSPSGKKSPGTTQEKLNKVQVAPTQADDEFQDEVCGDLKCEDGGAEDCHSCPQDCGCDERLICLKTSGEKWRCTAPLAM